MVPEPAPVPTRRPLPLGSAWRPLAAGLVCPLAAGSAWRPLAAGSAASDATQKAAAADTANAAIRVPRAMAARPRAPRNMLHPAPRIMRARPILLVIGQYGFEILCNR